MRYLLLIYSPESIMGNMNESEQGAYMDQWFAYTADLQAAGKMLAGEALQPVATATTVRGSIVSDGPFAETKEALGGFYMIEADSVDDALVWAKKMPSVAKGGAVEVRPIMELG
jgi:hypothetical protein